MKTFTVTPELGSLLEQMSRDMAVPVEGLVNQAVFNWAKLHGYLEPGRQHEELSDEPETGRVTVVEEAEPDWKVAAPASFSSPDLMAPLLDSTSPSIPKLPQVVLVLADREVVVDSLRFLVGRDVSCDLTIDSARISRQHAIVHVLEDGVELEDLGSSNGTWYDGERIERRKLVHGDEVSFGDTAVRFEFR